MIKAVLFDMDGVLYDSMPNHVQAWYETMQEYNVECTLEDFYLYEGRTGHSTINLLFNRTFGRDATEEEKESVYLKKSDRFMQLNDAERMPGAWEVLEKVREKGLDCVIVTGSGQLSLFEKLNTDYPGVFQREKMVTAYDVKIGKPHPEPYWMGLKKANAQSNEALVVENAPLGIQSAVAAGIFTVGVNTGPLNPKVLRDAGAQQIYTSMKALADDFENLLKTRS